MSEWKGLAARVELWPGQNFVDTEGMSISSFSATYRLLEIGIHLAPLSLDHVSLLTGSKEGKGFTPGHPPCLGQGKDGKPGVP